MVGPAVVVVVAVTEVLVGRLPVTRPQQPPRKVMAAVLTVVAAVAQLLLATVAAEVLVVRVEVPLLRGQAFSALEVVAVRKPTVLGLPAVLGVLAAVVPAAVALILRQVRLTLAAAGVPAEVRDQRPVSPAVLVS
jgi:hypothetical protein